MHFSAIIPCFGNHLIFVSDFRQLPGQYLLQFFPFFATTAFASSIFIIAWGIGINLRTKLWWLSEFIPFAAMWFSWYLWGTPSNRIFIDSSASAIQAFFVLCYPILRQVSLLLWYIGVLQGIAAVIGISIPTFYEHFSCYAWILHRQVQ